MTFPLIARYGDPLALVSEEPLRVSDIYIEWSRLPPTKPLSRRERNERRWLAKYLEIAAKKGQIRRVKSEHRIYFVAVATDGTGGDQPGGADGGAQDRHADRRGVDQRRVRVPGSL